MPKSTYFKFKNQKANHKKWKSIFYQNFYLKMLSEQRSKYDPR